MVCLITIFEFFVLFLFLGAEVFGVRRTVDTHALQWNLVRLFTLVLQTRLQTCARMIPSLTGDWTDRTHHSAGIWQWGAMEHLGQSDSTIATWAKHLILFI